MPSDIDYHGRRIRIRDMDLVNLLAMVEELALHSGERAGGLMDGLIDAWEQHNAFAPAGAIELHLDEFLTPAKANALVALLREFRVSVDQRFPSGSVPFECLAKTRLGAPGLFSVARDESVHRLKESCSRLLWLLTGDDSGGRPLHAEVLGG